MLLQRILTSLVLLAVILAAIFGLPSQGFSVFLAVVIGAAIWEWTALAGLQGITERIFYLLLLLVIMGLTQIMSVPLALVLLAGLCCWLLALWMICIFPAGQDAWGNKSILCLIGIPLFIPGWVGLNYLREQDVYVFHLLMLPSLVAAADIGAYFSGRAFGRHKMAPRVSPNKTWEGMAGGMLACAVLVTLVGVMLPGIDNVITEFLWVGLIASAVTIGMFSVIGDLFESMVKRFRNVKDSGNLLPGHGGILDRIDGLTSAVPLYVLLTLAMGPFFQ